MPKPPSKVLSGSQNPFQSKTLFLPAPGERGVLVTRTGRRRLAAPLRFPGPEAALAWCLEKRVSLVFYFGDLAALN